MSSRNTEMRFGFTSADKGTSPPALLRKFRLGLPKEDLLFLVAATSAYPRGRVVVAAFVATAAGGHRNGDHRCVVLSDRLQPHPHAPSGPCRWPLGRTWMLGRIDTSLLLTAIARKHAVGLLRADQPFAGALRQGFSDPRHAHIDASHESVNFRSISVARSAG